VVILISISLSKTGAVIDGVKVSREEFFQTLNAWGKDKSKKFVCLHRSILSEGINVSELEAVIFLRNMDAIEMLQTVGRVIELVLLPKLMVCYVFQSITTLVFLQRKLCNVVLILCLKRVRCMIV
jgi:hypothetical protein